jgi:hypothetical protein
MAITLDPRNVLTEEEALAYLGVSTLTDRQILQLNGVTAQIENHCGVAIIQKSYTGRYPMPTRQTGATFFFRSSEGFAAGSSKYMYLRQYPIVSVTSIVDEQATPQSIPARDYYIRTKEGILEHYSVWPTPYAVTGSGGENLVGEWVVTHVAGHFASQAEIDADVKHAAFIMLDQSINVKAGVNRIKSSKLEVEFGGTTGITTGGLPAEARTLLGKYRINRVI